MSINEDTKVKMIGWRKKKRKGSQGQVKVETEEIISTLDLYPQLGKIFDRLFELNFGLN